MTTLHSVLDSDSTSMIASKAEVELVTSTVDDNLLPPIADSPIPEDEGTSNVLPVKSKQFQIASACSEI
jgi:hypothetical protein